MDFSKYTVNILNVLQHLVIDYKIKTFPREWNDPIFHGFDYRPKQFWGNMLRIIPTCIKNIAPFGVDSLITQPRYNLPAPQP